MALGLSAEAEAGAAIIGDEATTIVETFIKTAAGNRVAFGAKIAIDVEFPAGALKTTEAGVELEVAESEVENWAETVVVALPLLGAAMEAEFSSATLGTRVDDAEGWTVAGTAVALL